MTVRDPPRLKHRQGFGSIFRAAGDLEIPAERLAANGEEIQSRVAAGAATSAVWRIGLPIFGLAVLVGSYAMRGGDDRAAGGVATPITVAAPDAGMPVVDRAEPPERALTAGRKRQEPLLATADVDVTADAAARAPERAVARDSKTRPQSASARDAAVPTESGAAARIEQVDERAPDVDSGVTSSHLPEQILLYEKAKEAGQTGAFDRGVALLDELLERFPSSPLRADAELTRAEFYVRGGRTSEAVRALTFLAADPTHAGRRGELLRTLGDLYRKRGDCAHATASYERALQETLSRRERRAAERGLNRCAGEER